MPTICLCEVFNIITMLTCKDTVFSQAVKFINKSILFLKGSLMNDQQLLTLFVGVIMVCMVIIATAIIFIAVHHTKALRKATAFIELSQTQLSALCLRGSLMLDDVDDLIATIEEKAHFLALKANGGIAQLTNASTVIKTFLQIFTKKSTKEEDTMNQNNLLSFVLGATITSIGAYYAYKNKDAIACKINDLEETLVDDYEILVEKAKAKLEALSLAFQETTEGLLNTNVEDVVKGSEIKHLMKKLDKLQKEIQTLSKA